MKQLTSILAAHYNDLMQITSTEELLQRVNEIVNTSKINPQDKRRMQLDLSRVSSSHIKLQSYLTNSMLKFQGMGVNRGQLPTL